MTDRSPQHILQSGNPLTGKDLRDLTGMDELSLWRHCHQNPDILLKIVGKRYLRFDRQVKGFARMSPSIKREFLTYTVCGLKKDAEEVNRHVHSLAGEIQKISRDKFQFARDTITKVVGSLDFCDRVNEQVCFIIAGDIVYEMAHLEPRPEVSTGRLVKGSDLDIIIVAEEGFPDDLLTLLDKAIYQEKYMCLIKPDIREEIDYIIKDMQKTRDQLKFDRFEHMVASKILWEGRYFDGSKKVFEQIQRMLKEFHIPEKITRLTREAEKSREKAQMFLLKGTSRITEEESYRLFYTKEEAEEIY